MYKIVLCNKNIICIAFIIVRFTTKMMSGYYIFFQYPVLIVLLIHYVKLEDIKDLSISELLQLFLDTAKFDDAKKEDVGFYEVTRLSPRKKLIPGSKIDAEKTFKFIIHGWIENSRRGWYEKLTSEFLTNGDFIVIQVDWEKPARTNYISSATNCKVVGKYIADFILQSQIPPENVHIIGHSLGAHIGGFAAKEIKKRIERKPHRISGLDPAGPYFNQFRLFPEGRLSKHDADIVDIMHTDSNKYGISYPIGTLDIFVNGGHAPQPGCTKNFNPVSLGSLVEQLFCSHARSIVYYIEWINNGKIHCKMYSHRSPNVVESCVEKIVITEEGINVNTMGICIANTSTKKPYLSEE